MLNGSSPDEVVSARGPIAIRYRSPLRSSKEHELYRAVFHIFKNILLYPDTAVPDPSFRNKKEMQCNNAMPDFIITAGKFIIRKSPNHIQNTLLIGDSTSLSG